MLLNSEKLKHLVKDEKALQELMLMLNDNPLYPANQMLNVFNDGNFLFWVSSMESEGNGVFISESAKNITGFTPDELKRMPGHIISRILDEDITGVRRSIAELDKNVNLQSTSLSYRIKNKAGEIIWLKGRVNVHRNTEGKVLKYFNIFVDITEQKNLIINLENALETHIELNKTKDRFISIVSHDLRAPFTSLLGFSEILLNETELPRKEREEYLTYIYEASKNQLQLINYLLDWSRLQTGKITVEPKRQKARDILSNCIAQLTGSAMRKNIDIHLQVGGDVFINADERLLTQAIMNLLSNAIKFTPEFKNIQVSAQKFKEGLIEIVIKDEGIGISEEHQSKIFKLDQKLTLEGTHGETGSGLGLTLVKEIVTKHAGEIWFYSQKNKGSEFHFTIPEAKDLVLLVEDDLELRKLYQRIIRKALPNFEIIIAENGYEAISLMLSQIPSLVITDHDMPLMNGIQLVEAMQKNETSRFIPIIVISAKFSDQIKSQYLGLGVNKLLPKPCDHEVLIKAIKDSIEIQ